MPRVPANGIEIEYETYGAESARPLLLVGGLGVQLTKWTDTFVNALVERDFRVIAYDNRDVGLSTKFDDWGPADIKGAFKLARAREPVPAPYTLEDMAADGVALLDQLGIRSAHVVGGSNGGAIAQLMAVEHVDRVASLTSIMATSGRRGLPRPAPAAAEWLAKPRNPSGTREGAMDDAVETARLIGSPAYPAPEEELRADAARQYDRDFSPAGNGRQLLASIASGDGRVARLGDIQAPTLIIHGRDDPLVPLGCAEDFHATVAGSEMLVLDGMGHDYPDALVPQMADAIAANAARSTDA